jgi:CheY-like chemotaxis protein
MKDGAAFWLAVPLLAPEAGIGADSTTSTGPPPSSEGTAVTEAHLAPRFVVPPTSATGSSQRLHRVNADPSAPAPTSGDTGAGAGGSVAGAGRGSAAVPGDPHDLVVPVSPPVCGPSAASFSKAASTSVTEIMKASASPSSSWARPSTKPRGRGGAVAPAPHEEPQGPASSLHGVRVLYVDDEDVNRNVGRRMLERLGCVPSLLVDGAEVEPALAAGMQVDVLLLDIQMKEMNGDEVCKRLRQQGITSPIIAVTGVVSCPPFSPLPLPHAHTLPAPTPYRHTPCTPPPTHTHMHAHPSATLAQCPSGSTILTVRSSALCLITCVRVRMHYRQLLRR